MELTHTDLDRLCAIAQDAGDAIMQVYASGSEVWDKPDDSPLTEADLRADEIICSRLARDFPGTPILSEESGRTGTASGGVTFLVDPLDGTREFLKRNGEFTVNIALVVDGVPRAGVVLAPALGEMYAGLQGAGAWKSKGGARANLRATRYAEGAPLRIVGSRSHGADRLNAWLDSLPVPYRFEAAGSSLKFCRVAEGAADLYPRLGPTSQWDTAAAQCVLDGAGGCVLDLAGTPLTYGANRPVLNPEFLAMGDHALFERFRTRLPPASAGEPA
jgi:3'(2'),5'-bisphosphate nucleotidase